MINQIYPCLWFNGEAKAAAAFYCSIFPNSTIFFADVGVLHQHHLSFLLT